MPKQKTVKCIRKRVSVTGTGVLRKKTAGQDHYNSRESGTVTRNKRRLRPVSKADAKNIKRSINLA